MYRYALLFIFLFPCSRSVAQTPVNELLKRYVTEKGIAVEQNVLNGITSPADSVKVTALAKTVTFDDEYPKVLGRFQKQLEGVLAKEYSFVSFTKDTDNEKTVMFYYRVFGTMVELIVVEKEDDGEDKDLTVHLTDFYCYNMSAENIEKVPFTIKVNGFEGVVKPVAFEKNTTSSPHRKPGM